MSSNFNIFKERNCLLKDEDDDAFYERLEEWKMDDQNFLLILKVCITEIYEIPIIMFERNATSIQDLGMYCIILILMLSLYGP